MTDALNARPPRPPLSHLDFAPVYQDEESGGPLVLDGPFIETKELALSRCGGRPRKKSLGM
jgi:hypothetical protein